MSAAAAGIARRPARGLYLPAWPGLAPRLWTTPETGRALPFPLEAPRTITAFAARYLIYHLFRALGFGEGGTVLVPDYHHGTEVRALRAAGAAIVWYPVRRNLQADLDALDRLLRRGPRALFLIHYLGWPQPIAEIARLCRENGVTLVEDCALAFLSGTGGRPLGSFGDYAVFCLYKTLPVPNGAALAQNSGALEPLAGATREPCDRISLGSRCLELTLESIRGRSRTAGRLLVGLKRAAGRALGGLGVDRVPVGDEIFDLERARLGMSPLTARLLKRFDYGAIRSRRRRNFLLLREALGGEGLLPGLDLEEGTCPLSFPLLVSDKQEAARLLWAKGIGAVELWNRGLAEAEGASGPDALFLRRHLLELPIHQDIDEARVRDMADVVTGLRPRALKNRTRRGPSAGSSSP